MAESVSKTSSDTTGDIIAGNQFFGKNRERPIVDSDTGKIVNGDTDEIFSQVCVDQRVWSKLPEELLIHIFVRLPVNDIILRIRFLNRSWRSTITSPEFQQAFVDASVVRVALMVSDEVDGTMFLTQENKEECFRFQIARHPELTEGTSVAATADGLVCVIEEEEPPRRLLFDFRIVGIRVFVMNIVTGVRRELPPPRIMTARPKLVRMEKNVVEGGYTITFIYTKGLHTSKLEVFSWLVYDSATNSWRTDDAEALAHLKDVDVFNMYDCRGYFYENVATFHKESKEIKVFNLHASYAKTDPAFFIPDPNGQVHNVSGEFYKLCMREKKHGVWKLTNSGEWEMVCEISEVKDVQTCLRVMNDWVVLVFKFPDQFRYKDAEGRQHLIAGTIVKVFHMPSKSWNTFPEEEYFVYNWGLNDGEMFNKAFIVEVSFDAIP